MDNMLKYRHFKTKLLFLQSSFYLNMKCLLIKTIAITNAVKRFSNAEHSVDIKDCTKNYQVSRLKTINHCNNVFDVVKSKSTLLSKK